MAEKEPISWKVSKDGKTVTAGGKTYSVDAFKNQFSNIYSPITTASGEKSRIVGQYALRPGESGYANMIPGKTTVKVGSGQEAAKPKPKAVKKTATTRAQVTAAAKGGSIKAADKPRSQGGIGKGADGKVNPVYRMMGRGGGLGGMFGKLPK